jgi:hypothetical protein
MIRFLEKLGGAQPFKNHSIPVNFAIGLWWATLLIGIILFIGRSAKFIYVDF